jgi:IS5 family transposase
VAGARALAREGRKLAGRLRGPTVRVVDRSRRIGKLVRAISRTLARRTNQGTDEVLALNAKAGRAMARSVREARALAAQARAAARGRGARAKLRAAQRLEDLADRCQRVATQIQQRQRREKITDRLVSLADPDARPIRKGKLGKPNEFGYVAQIAEVTANTRRGARGYVLPAATAPGNPGENRLLDQTAAALTRLDLAPREVALGGAFVPGPTGQTLAGLAPARVFIAGGPSRARAVPAAPGPLPHRLRGPHQPPQARLRTATQPPERPPGTADLDRLGDPGLQPGHPRHPHHLTSRRSAAGPTSVTRLRPPHPPFIRGK